ncbi:MAG: prolipoprotein diacylglyceryl transferase [Anaerolineales bacterium]
MNFMFDGIHLSIFGGEFTIYYYGIILMAGTMAGGWLAAREMKRRGHNPELVWDALIWLVIGTIIGARLWHVFTPSPSSIAEGITTQWYFAHPIDLINLRRGGLGVPGGVIGGAIALFFYVRRNPNLDFSEWVDIIAPSLALGQAIGRWGNFFNQELYGAPTDLPWKLSIDPQHRLQGFANVQYYHPLFLYESLLNLANMFLLIWVTRKFKDVLKPGDVFLVYLVTYPVIRFFLEFLRLDASQLAGINANQTFMAIVAVVAVAALLWRHRKIANSRPDHSTGEA